MSERLKSVVVPGSVDEVVAALQDTLQRRGIRVFASIDHAAGAREAGLDLADEVLVIFGDPGVGSTLMQDRPDVGYDLPLRVLVRAEAGRTVLVYRDPAALVDEYGLTDSAATAAKLSALLSRLADELVSRA